MSSCSLFDQSVYSIILFCHENLYLHRLKLLVPGRRIIKTKHMFTWRFLLFFNVAGIIEKENFCRNFFLTDSRHKRLENTLDLLLLYGEHFHGFSESDNLGTSRLFRLKKRGQNYQSVSKTHFDIMIWTFKIQLRYHWNPINYGK